MNKWTPVDEQFLRTVMGYFTYREIAEAMGRSIPSVKLKAKRIRKLNG